MLTNVNTYALTTLSVLYALRSSLNAPIAVELLYPLFVECHSYHTDAVHSTFAP